jgi:hypothetical protein
MKNKIDIVKIVRDSLIQTADTYEALVYQTFSIRGVLDQRLVDRWLDTERMIAAL